MALRREDEDEVLSDPNSYLPQAGQDVCLGRKVEAQGCCGTVTPSHEIRHVLQVLGRELATLLVRERLTVAPPRGDQQQSQELGQADRNHSLAEPDDVYQRDRMKQRGCHQRGTRLVTLPIQQPFCHQYRDRLRARDALPVGYGASDHSAFSNEDH